MATKRGASEVLEDEELTKRLREEGAIDENTMVIIQEGSAEMGDIMESTLSLEETNEVTLGDDVEEETIQMTASELGEAGYTITTADNGETYISSADGQILTQVNTAGGQLVYNTEDGEQVVLQEEQDGTGGQLVIAPTDANLDEENMVQDQSGQFQNIIIQHMDISEPLTTLRRLLEGRLHCSLKSHEFYLQDAIQLDAKKNLTTQCVQGSGMVQINIEVKSAAGIGQKPRLNIVDILKPAEDQIPEEEVPQQAHTATPGQKARQKVVIPFPEENENVTRWIVDQNFRREQERLRIPQDPGNWNEAHVNHWIQWAIDEFKLTSVHPESFAHITGKDLCSMKHDEFTHLVPDDKGDIFWTHLELLRKCRFVAVIQQPTPHAITTITVSSSDPLAQKSQRISRPTGKGRSIFLGSDRITPGNRTGNNGQIQLWQFLLELLTDKDCREIIHWVGDEGEFKLANPEMVAQLWGARKNKSTMNYEKLSRALRYYYDGDMIAKVHGKRLTYKFICDLAAILGYSAGELRRRIEEVALHRRH